jgi:hypothetical protein
MSVSLREVIEAGGYDLTTIDDARWLLAQRHLFEEMIADAEEVVEEYENEVQDES